MKEYTVYQIVLTDAERLVVNARSQSWVDFYFNSKFNPTIEDVTKLMLKGKYKAVALICGDSLDEIFDASNMGMESKITRLTDRMHSISVGDVIEDEYENLFIVNNIGFTRIH